MQELINLLTRERVLLERLLYRVTNVRNLLVGGQARFLAWAADEVDEASAAVSQILLTRAVYYQRLADARPALPDEFDWEALIDAGTETEAALLRGLRSDIGVTSAELQGHLAACRDLSESGQTSAAAALAQLQGVDLSAATTLTPAVEQHRHIDRSL